MSLSVFQIALRNPREATALNGMLHSPDTDLLGGQDGPTTPASSTPCTLPARSSSVSWSRPPTYWTASSPSKVTSATGPYRADHPSMKSGRGVNHESGVLHDRRVAQTRARSTSTGMDVKPRSIEDPKRVAGALGSTRASRVRSTSRAIVASSRAR